MKLFTKAGLIICVISLFLTPIVASQGIVNKDVFYKQRYWEKIIDIIEQKYTTSSYYDLLIIAPSTFERSLHPLVRHKEKYGIKTRLVTTEEIYDVMFWDGRDDAEKIKYYIKNAVEFWGVKYVLLVGGRKNQGPTEKWWVPVRYSTLDRRYGSMVERRFLSDLYFADIYDQHGHFSSWDSNNNGVFGEWPEDQPAIDIPDLHPDVYLGRLPCLNVFEVRTIVRKIIQYETGKGDYSWFKTMVVVAGDTYPDKTDYIDGEVYTQQGLDMMPGFHPVKLWVSDGSLTNWVDVVKAVNSGCGFLWFSGHGNPKSWATHPPHDNETWVHGLRLRNIPFFHNRQKLPVCITGSGCFNSMFNVSFFNSPWVYGLSTPHCFSWALVIKRRGGCIATIGSTAFSYESPDINLGVGGIEWLDIHFFYYYGIEHVDILGEIWAKTVHAFLDEHPIIWCDSSADGAALIAKNAEQWVLIGDPSLKIGGYSIE